MFTIKKTKHGYSAQIGFFKTGDNVCTGNPCFYILALQDCRGDYVLELGIMDEDDIDIYEYYGYMKFKAEEELLRAFEYACMELYDKRYLRSTNLYRTYADYVGPLRKYLGAS